MLVEQLQDRLFRRADREVIRICAGRSRQPDHVFSGRQLHQAALERAASLLRLVDPDDGPVVLVMPCGPDFVVSLYGALYAGLTVTAVAAPRPGVATTRFEQIIRDCRPAVILCSDGLTPRLRTALAGGPAEGVRIVDVASLTPSGVLDAPRDPAADRPVILQYTSGSTRAPKAVALSGANILANAGLANGTWGLDETGVVLSWLPHFHDLGLMGGLFYPMLAGAPSMLLDPLQMIQRPERWLRLISDHGVTLSGGPAFAFSHCLQNVTDAQCEGLDLSRWRAAFCGAEPVPAALLEAFRQRFEPWGLRREAVFGCYGLAEYTLMVAGGNPTLSAERPSPPAGCGDIEPCRIAPEMQGLLRLVDPDTRRLVAPGETGEVWVRGPSVTQGYRNEPAETAAVYGAAIEGEPSIEGWLRTGDLALRQGDWLYVTGRIKDILFVNGRKIPATDVEWLAGEQDPALNPMAAAALMTDELATGKAVLLIELNRRARVADESATMELIRRAVAGAWGIELTDIRIVPSGALPRTSSGKIQRRLLTEAWQNGSVDRVLQ